MKNRNIWLITGVILATVIFVLISQKGTNTKETVKIGNILYMSGPLAALGEQELNGMKMAEEHINANGGIKGKELEIVTQDYAGDSKKAVAAYELLKTQKINSILIDGGSAVSSVIPLIRQDGVFSMVPVAVTPTYFDNNQKTCRIAVTADRYAAGIGDYLTKNFENPRISFLVSANEYGNAVRSEVTKVLEKNNGSVVISETYESAASDFRTQITKIKENQDEIDALIIINANSSIEPMLRQVRQLGFNKLIIADTFTILNPALKDLSAAEGVVFVDYSFGSQPDQGDTEAMANFKKEFYSKYVSYPGVAAINGYDSVMIIAKAMNNVNNINPKSITDYITNTKFSILDGEIGFNSDCEVDREIEMRVIKGGVITSVK